MIEAELASRNTTNDVSRVFALKRNSSVLHGVHDVQGQDLGKHLTSERCRCTSMSGVICRGKYVVYVEQ